MEFRETRGKSKVITVWLNVSSMNTNIQYIDTINYNRKLGG